MFILTFTMFTASGRGLHIAKAHDMESYGERERRIFFKYVRKDGVTCYKFYFLKKNHAELLGAQIHMIFQYHFVFGDK